MPGHSGISPVPADSFAPDRRQESKEIHQESQVEVSETASSPDDISLYSFRFQFAEQFRQTDIFGLISGLASVDSQCISNKTLAGTCGSVQDDIQPLVDVVIIRQALQKILVRQILNASKKYR